jgi:hypothetical protein
MQLYNVSWAVGEGMPNNPDDVMFVQWMLKRHFSRNDKRALLGKHWDIHVLNGVCGEALIDIIRIYQYDAILNVPGVKYKLDGKLYPIQSCHGGVNHSPIVSLNFSVGSNFKKFYDNPASDPFIVSSEMREMLKRSFRGKMAA